jgi:hypothetical protein
VGHPEGLVADDGHPGARFDRRFGFSGRHPEGGVLEVVRDLAFGQRRRCVEEVFVERLLVGEVRRQTVRAFEFEQLLEVVEPVGTGRQDVAEAAGVVGPVRLGGGGGCSRQSREDEQQRECQ